MKSIFDALNLVYDEREKRGVVRLNLVSLAFTTAGILFALLAIGAMVVAPVGRISRARLRTNDLSHATPWRDRLEEHCSGSGLNA